MKKIYIQPKLKNIALQSRNSILESSPKLIIRQDDTEDAGWTRQDDTEDWD